MAAKINNVGGRATSDHEEGASSKRYCRTSVERVGAIGVKVVEVWRGTLKDAD